ncbi:flagellar hook protein FlgE [Microvirga lotononidis]|uniref:Flagellar hook protein FlgE n=1 Tax=Microvirga lotononidis TaxID=864069 RepID=I4YLS3_9HYPH|nr:flagellar hook protein FlgE [Microvirga lotononidis]EIM24915.1 flagellar hook-basal body protein [Microvirga lotononidis]WQO29584.1 flagellar hook protein FlgE [Microvirga lotononidis]
MSLYGVLRSGVSGMNAQSNKLGTVAENIQNSSTTGYKRASTEFSSLILPSSEGNYNSGSVTSRVRYTIAEQGPIAYTTSPSDLAISGNGFFVVTDPGGSPYLTRAGNFVKDGRTGNLVNAYGFTLMGYKLGEGAVNPSLNSLDGVVPVNMSSFAMQASGSTKGTFKGNLPDGADVAVPPAVTKQSSLQVYDKVGNPIKIDISLSKISPTEWSITVANGSDPASPLTGTTSMNLTFNADGQITGPAVLSFGIPGGEPFDLDMSGMTQLAGEYNVTGQANGNAPSAVKDVEFASDGTVYAVYEDGTRVGAYRIPLANVSSPDNLSPRAGNVYETTAQSGGYQVGFPEMSGFGSIASGALEGSNVDIGTELTAMIEAQTSYTANSKVFQTGSELLDVLMNLKR